MDPMQLLKQEGLCIADKFAKQCILQQTTLSGYCSEWLLHWVFISMWLQEVYIALGSTCIPAAYSFSSQVSCM